MHPPDPAAVTAAAPAGALSRDELVRYSRHLLLPEVGLEGQRRLRGARVLLIGAGGLGSPAALYLAAAGVGHVGLVDFDRVDATNLQRQILYGTSDVGRLKTEAAAERLTDLNPAIQVQRHEERLSRENALDTLRPYDVILDGSDNFATRYLVNDACVLLRKPDVFGSIYRFDGQATVFDAARGPCYRCLFPEPPPPELVPSCAEAGVLGVLPGLVGTLQAIEALKLILGIGEPLIGRLLMVDALGTRFREVALRKDPACVLCGEQPTQTGLIDYPAFCGDVGAANRELEVGPVELLAELGGNDPPYLVDVREPSEWELGHIDGATLIPLGQLGGHLGELEEHRSVVLYCKSGNRSGRGARQLRDRGIAGVRSLRGGIDAWTRDVDRSLPAY